MFPSGWPPRPASSVRSIRFFADATSADTFAANAFLFGETAAKSMVDPVPVVVGGESALPAAVGTSASPVLRWVAATPHLRALCRRQSLFPTAMRTPS